MANAAQAYCWMLATVHFSGIFFAHASCRGLQVKSEPHSKCMYAYIYIYMYSMYVVFPWFMSMLGPCTEA